LLAGLAAAGYGALTAWRTTPGPGTDKADRGRAFDLRAALLFAVMVSAILVGTAGLQAWLGMRGMYLASALAGFADGHAPAISVASLVNAGRFTAADAVVPILLGLTTNTLSKMIVAVGSGGWGFARRTIPGLLLVLLAAWAGWWLGR
jgi:uncharacterized membrane protein (DUF4010 family)